MALELVATAFLTVAFEKLFKRLSSKEFADFFRGKKSVDDQLKVLTEKLKTVRLLLVDAEDKQMENPEVKVWLDNLKDVIFKVDDLVEEITEEARIKSSESDQSGSRSIVVLMKSRFTFFTEFDTTVEADVTKCSRDLDILMDRAAFLDLKPLVQRPFAQNARSSAQRPFAPLREESSVFGRDDDKEKILNLLLSSDDRGNKIGVLPIVGMGGLGKTTLAQLVYNDERVKKEHKFELKAWVTVSTEFNVFKIIKSLLQQIGRASDSEEPEVLQQEMKEALRGKKFLVVLDDVWDENYQNWDLLKSNFAAGDSRSKIIVTTRSRKVCSIANTGPIHELELVSCDDCWKIFVHHAFDGDLNADKELQEIGKRIVDKCKGLPLAVKVVGGLLRCERNSKKWETILGSQAWSRDQTSGVLPSLWLSYRYLPSPMKQCFAYCAIFPQDHDFDRKEMVLFWMAEGFLLPAVNEKSLEEVGDEYFEVLISRSFFQRSSYDESRYVMHDLVHDLATFVSGQFCLSLSEDRKVSNISSKTRYLYCDSKLVSDSLKFLEEATYLHTYIDKMNKSTKDSLVEKILEDGRFLRVFCVQRRSVCELLSSPKNHLKHLRYLNLSESSIDEVPDSVCTLYSLQTLVLSYCYRLSKLPTDMGNLINLRHLNTSGSDGIKKMPPRMGNLKELRTLTDFVLGKADGNEGCSSTKEFGELPHLAGELHVRGLQNVETDDDARKANFREKSNLVKLVLQWEGESSDTIREWEVLDALQPHTNLEKLKIRGYAASRFPKWVGDSSFSKMVSLTLEGSSSHSFCSSLPPLGQLASLKKLEIKYFNWIESIGPEFYGGSNSLITAFPCLETLKFENMERWKEWSFVGKDDNESFGYFPRLKQLQLFECPLDKFVMESLLDCERLLIEDSLNSMEFFPLDKFPKLKRLKLSGCPKLKSITSSSTEDHKLISLEIVRCPEMESFPQGGLPSRLESLVILDCRKLVEQNRQWDLQRLTSLTSLRIIANWESPPNNFDSFPQGLLPASLTYFKLDGFENLKTLNGSAFEQLKSLQELKVWSCNELESLPEQVLPQSLRSLEIRDCRFLETSYRKDEGDQWHWISHIPQIDISGRMTLEKDRRQSDNSASTIG